MRHAVTRLLEEMRTLLQTWRALRVDCSTAGGWRYRMEAQTAREIIDVHCALERLRANDHAIGLTSAEQAQVRHVIEQVGKDG